WVAGNAEAWTDGRDPVRLRGEERYLALVAACRGLGVVTPEDPYPVWTGDGGPLLVVPLFVLYDYSFRPVGAGSVHEGLAMARAAGGVRTGEGLAPPPPPPTPPARGAPPTPGAKRRRPRARPRDA